MIISPYKEKTENNGKVIKNDDDKTQMYRINRDCYMSEKQRGIEAKFFLVFCCICLAIYTGLVWHDPHRVW